VVATPLSARELQTANCANLSPREAAILIHFLPQGEQLRRQGMDIGWERAPKAEVGRNAFVFWVYNAKRTATGSVTIGYFVVDRCTANVTDDANGTTVKSPTLAALQRILSP
jgi:hypothetical protein